MKRMMQEYGMFLAAAVIGVTLILLYSRLAGVSGPGSKMMRESVKRTGGYYQIEMYSSMHVGRRSA